MLHATKGAAPFPARRFFLIVCAVVGMTIFSLAVIGPASSASSQRHAHEGEDDWQFEEEYARVHKDKSPAGGIAPMGGSVRRLPGATPPASPAARAGNLGFPAGGAKDIAKGFLPLATDVTYEGLFYDHSFETGGNCSGNVLFCPTYARPCPMIPAATRPIRTVP